MDEYRELKPDENIMLCDQVLDDDGSHWVNIPRDLYIRLVEVGPKYRPDKMPKFRRPIQPDPHLIKKSNKIISMHYNDDSTVKTIFGIDTVKPTKALILKATLTLSFLILGSCLVLIVKPESFWEIVILWPYFAIFIYMATYRIFPPDQKEISQKIRVVVVYLVILTPEIILRYIVPLFN